jgi:23S rRNA (adenine2030-N6)-methyltransferase
VNYRHAYHAGNFADVMKHVLLTRILVHLARKEAPFRVVDTHAGTGLYDLEAEAAGKTAEWRAGVARMHGPFSPDVEELLVPYRAVLESVRARHGASAYPGSPAIVRELIRRQDRGVFVELHPADAKALSSRFNAVSNLKVMRLDGWTALHALIPPNERRGLVLVDPPYEEPGELDRLASELLKAARKWPTGIYAGWYPIKDVDAVGEVAARLAHESARPGLRLEMLIDHPNDRERLNGSGLLVLNPPWMLREEADVVLPALAGRLSRSGYGAFRCERFGPEA